MNNEAITILLPLQQDLCVPFLRIKILFLAHRERSVVIKFLQSYLSNSAFHYNTRTERSKIPNLIINPISSHGSPRSAPSWTDEILYKSSRIRTIRKPVSFPSPVFHPCRFDAKQTGLSVHFLAGEGGRAGLWRENKRQVSYR